MRAREVALPTAEDIAAAERDLVIIRRNYVPPAPLSTGRRITKRSPAKGQNEAEDPGSHHEPSPHDRSGGTQDWPRNKPAERGRDARRTRDTSRGRDAGRGSRPDQQRQDGRAAGPGSAS